MAVGCPRGKMWKSGSAFCWQARPPTLLFVARPLVGFAHTVGGRRGGLRLVSVSYSGPNSRSARKRDDHVCTVTCGGVKGARESAECAR
eukprot:scaffold4641_cov117-Isochrysis_galbana.AAC.16